MMEGDVAIRFFNSVLYYHVYYKHTKKHKADMKAVHDRVIAERIRILGK